MLLALKPQCARFLRLLYHAASEGDGGNVSLNVTLDDLARLLPARKRRKFAAWSMMQPLGEPSRCAAPCRGP